MALLGLALGVVMVALTPPPAGATGATGSLSTIIRGGAGQLDAGGLQPGANYAIASRLLRVPATVAADSTGHFRANVTLPIDVPLSETTVQATVTPAGDPSPVVTATAVIGRPQLLLAGVLDLCPGQTESVAFRGFPPGTYDFAGPDLTFTPSRDTFDANGVPQRMSVTLAAHSTTGIAPTVTPVGAGAPVDTVSLISPGNPVVTPRSIGPYVSLAASCLHPGTTVQLDMPGPGVVIAAPVTVAADGSAAPNATVIPYTYARTIDATVTDADGGRASTPVTIPSTTLRAGQTASALGGATPDLMSPHPGFMTSVNGCQLGVYRLSRVQGYLEAVTFWDALSSLTPSMFCRLELRADGSLLYYDRSNRLLWSAETQFTGSANTLTLQDDGNLVERTSTGVPVWSSTYGRRTLVGGAQLALRQGLATWPHALRLEPDGNLVLLVSGHVVWQSHTAGRGGVRLLMQHDGNLVLYNGAGHSVWRSNTAGTAAGGFVQLVSPNHTTAYLGVYTKDHHLVWSTPR